MTRNPETDTALPMQAAERTALQVTERDSEMRADEDPRRVISVLDGRKRCLSAQLIGAHLAREVTAEQINAHGGAAPMMRRAEIRAIDVAARTVELAFSSEAPVDRWFGEEVLSHAPGAINGERLDGGAPLLLQHDHDEQIGVVESWTIGADQIGRAVVRFGKGREAEEVWQDVVDGIRKHVSVGYSVDVIEIETRKGQTDLVTVTRWTPYEISIVSVPADATVGVGRAATGAGNPPEDRAAGGSHDDRDEETTPGAARAIEKDGPMKTKILRDAEGNLVRAEVDDDNKIIRTIEVLERAGEDVTAAIAAGATAEQTRTRSIMEMGRQYDALDLAAQHIQSQSTPEAFQRALLDHVAAQRGNRPLGAEGSDDIGLSDREVQNYSFLRVIRALINPHDKRAQEAAAFEIEASQAAAQRSGAQPKGLFIPPDVMRRALNTDTSGTAAGDTGGFLIANELMSQSFVDMLRSRTVAMQLGRPMGGLVGNLDIPRQVGGATGYWIGEGDDATEGSAELDQIGMSPKTVAAYTELTRKMLTQSSLDVEMIARSDLATSLALAIDKAFFYGSGSANQPRGLKNLVGINAIDFGGGASGGGVLLPTYAEMVQMETEIAADNADAASMAYVVNARMRGHLKTTEKFSGTTGSPVWEPGNTVNGYGAETTNQIATGDVFFGNFADALIGMWGGLDMTIDTATHSKSGATRIVMFQDTDFAFRRVESFCYGADAT
jgi:HK97 family phage major capsid protein